MKPKPTWLAVVIAAIGVIIPGLFVGAAGSLVYRFFVHHDIGSDPDFFMMRILFGFAAPGNLVKWLFYEGFPAAVHGGIAGAVAIGLAAWICRGANIQFAA